MDNRAKIKDMAVRITGNTRLPASEKSPMFACVRKISMKEVTMDVFDGFTNKAIKPMLMVTTDFIKSCI